MAHPRFNAGLTLLIFAFILATASVSPVWAQSATIDAKAQAVNFRLAPGEPPPPGARRLFADVYSLSTVDTAKTSAQLAGLVEWIEPNGTLSVPETQLAPIEGIIAAAVNDPRAGEQYSLSRMSVSPAWDAGAQGDGVVIAVVDSGIDFDHPDLAGKAVSRGRDFVNGDNDAADDHGHGTHVAGIAAAVTNNGVGMAGVGYNARLLPVKVLGANGSGATDAVAEGIAWAADQGAHIINLSFGSPYSSQTLQAAIEYASRSAVLVCAAGNSGVSQPFYPVAYPQCLTVAASDANDRLTSFSNFGSSWVDVAAPGAGVLGPLRGGSYQAWDGTSMAAPNVAGVAALVMARNRTWDRAQVRAAIEQGADPVLRDKVAFGRVNAARAVGVSTAPMPTPTAPPGVTPAPSGDYAREIVDLINQTRAANGLAALRYDARLQVAADFHNQWMRDHNCFSHNCDGEPPVMSRMRNAGYPVISAGETIGKGFRAPQDMLNGWMNSPGHRAALLNTTWPDIGCGYLRGPSGHESDSYWSCEFARGDGFVPISTTQPMPTRTPTPVTRPPLPTAVPLPTARPPMPPTDRVFLIEVRGGWREWDAAWYSHCQPPRPEYRCIFPPRSWTPWLSANDAESNSEQ